MAVNLSIKNAPEEMVEALKARAKRHHRSLQGELMVILEAAAQENRLAPEDVLRESRHLALPSQEEAADMIRKDRDDR